MPIPFRRSAACLLSTVVLAACGGGGKDAAGLGGIVDVASVVAVADDTPVQAAPVSTGVLTQPPATVLPAASIDLEAAAPVVPVVPVVPVTPTSPSLSVDPSAMRPVPTVVSPVAVVVPVTPAVVVPVFVDPAGSSTIVVPAMPVVDNTTAPVVPIPPITPVVPIAPVVTAPTYTTTPTRVVCASENNLCTFSGTRTVRYGTSSAWFERVATEQTPCDNPTFGDPASGQGKQCSVIVDVVTSSAGRPVAALGVYLGAEAGGVAKVDTYATWLGRRPDRALEFLSNDNWMVMEDAASRDAWLWTPTALGMTFSVSMLPADGWSTLAAGARGDYDGHWRTIAANFVRNGQADAVVRIGWEFNYYWYSWKASTSPQDFVAYWRRIVTAMRSAAGQNFRFDWCPAIGQGEIDTARAYPGDAWVDIIGLDVYNQTWASPVPSSDALWQTLLTQPFGLQWHRDFGLAHGKPISFPEWGTGTRPDGHGMGDDPVFIHHMVDWIADNDVAYHDYWDYRAPDYDAKLSDGNFPQAGAAFRAAY